MKKWTLLAIAMAIAVLLLWNEALGIVQSFFSETKIFFGSETVWSSNFLTYITKILSVLMLFYLFVGFWGKLSSPLMNIINIVGEVTNEKSTSMHWSNKYPIFGTIAVLYISIVFFTKILINNFAGVVETSIADILFQILSIATYFWLSVLVLALVRNATLRFVETEEGFQHITFYTAIYLFFIGVFYTAFWELTKWLSNLLSWLNIF